MTRVVIGLSADISPVMPDLCNLIDGCAYSPEAGSMAFRVEDARVIVENNSITIIGARDEMAARAIADWLIDLMNGKAVQYGDRSVAPRIKGSL